MAIMTISMCSRCGSERITARELQRYRYKQSGLDNVVLYGGVTEIRCGRCRESWTCVEKEWQLLQVIALHLFMKPGHLTGREIRYLRGACDLTQAELAARLDLRRESIAEREAKKDPGLTLAAEFFLRGVLLKAFRDCLRTEYNHLAKEHRKLLSDLERSFLQMVDRIQQNGRAKPLTFRPRDHAWGVSSPGRRPGSAGR